MTVLQGKARVPKSAKIGDYGFVVRNLVNGVRVWKGRPIFLYVRVGKQAGEGRGTGLTAPWRTKPLGYTHNNKSDRQASTVKQSAETGRTSKFHGKRRKPSSGTLSPNTLLPRERSKVQKQLTKSPLQQAILGAQPPQPPFVALDPPAIQSVGRSTNVSQLVKESVDTIMSHSRAPNLDAEPKRDSPPTTPRDSPPPGSAMQAPTSTPTRPSRTPLPSCRGSVDESTVVQSPPSTAHNFSLDQVLHTLFQDPQKLSVHAQTGMNDRQPWLWCHLLERQQPVTKNSLLHFAPTSYNIIAPMDGYITEVSSSLDARRVAVVSIACRYIFRWLKMQSYCESITPVS